MTREIRENKEIKKHFHEEVGDTHLKLSPQNVENGSSLKDLRSSINTVISKRECSWCDKPDFKFRDTLSRKEYGISAMCQTCQDEVFGK